MIWLSKKTLISLFLLVNLISIEIIAQTRKADSIDLVASLIHNDSVRADYLLKIAKNYAWKDLELAKNCAEEALNLAEKIGYKKGIASASFRLSRIYEDFDFELSKTFLLQALEGAKEISDSILIAQIYCSLGNLKGNFGSYDASEEYFNKSLNIFLRHDQDSSAAVIYNNLGVLHDRINPDSLSIENYIKATDISRKGGNHLLLAISHINIAINYIDMGKMNYAQANLTESIKIARKHHFVRLYPWIYNTISRYHFATGGFRKSVYYADTALMYAKEQSNLLQQNSAYERLNMAWLELSEMDSAYKYQGLGGIIRDSINETSRLKETEMLEMKFRFDRERKEKELEMIKIESRHNRTEMTYIIILLAAVLTILTFVFVFLQQRNKLKQKNLQQRNTELEKVALKNNLELKNKELTTNVMYLMKKNEFISSISDKLRLAISRSDKNYEDTIERIIAELDKSVSELNWEDFEIRFQEVYVGFYNRLSSKYPALTPNDLRLCAFLRLNMTSKEIADITFQSPESLKTARYRLRKKLGLDRQDNLVGFLTKV